jgi:hypothetical protein
LRYEIRHDTVPRAVECVFQRTLDSLIDTARSVAAAGLASIWFGQHSTWDPRVALSFVGRAVPNLELGTAALDRPDETVRAVVWPVVPGGEQTLRKLAKELMATEKAWRERVRVSLRGSYTHDYRRMLTPLLGAMRFKCNNTAYRPVMDAIELLARYTTISADQKQFAKGETVPIEGVVPKAWLKAVTGADGRIERVRTSCAC